ncbi:MAG: helix-turn-helix domain-containing protein [Candidatus Baldrarchaeia archaeon]
MQENDFIEADSSEWKPYLVDPKKVLREVLRICEKEHLSVEDVLQHVCCLNRSAVKAFILLLDNELTISEISEKLNVSRSWAQKLVYSLYRCGLIERRWSFSHQKFIYKADRTKAVRVIREVSREIIGLVEKILGIKIMEAQI